MFQLESKTRTHRGDRGWMHECCNQYLLHPIPVSPTYIPTKILGRRSVETAIKLKHLDILGFLRPAILALTEILEKGK